jgi:AcrR family transcriptional regulator
MDDIAQETGLSKGTLYLYFKSKDAIISAILESMITRELARARKIQQGDRTAEDKLVIMCEILVKDLKRMQPLLSLYFEFVALSLRRKKVKQIIREVFQSFMEIFIPVFEQGIEAGEFRMVNPKSAAIAAAAILEGTVLLWVYDPQMVSIEKNINESLQLLINGLKV